MAKTTATAKALDIGGKDGSVELRDWFAGQALMGIIANYDGEYEAKPDDFAAGAYRYADAMLRARRVDSLVPQA